MLTTTTTAFTHVNLRRRYIHDDSETTEDEVDLTVTDGLNSADVVLLIQVSFRVTLHQSLLFIRRLILDI